MGGTPPVDEFGLLGAAVEGKYAVESVVAAGGFGVVYRGRHQVLGNTIALKVLKVPPDMRDDVRQAFVQMFLNEARIVASLKHPAVVRAIDFGAVEYAEGRVAPWMALDWIDGVTLAEDLDARRGRGGRTPEEALALLTPVLEALAEAHEAGVVHRDIKPGNVMIPSAPSARGRRGGRAGAGETRLLDFGIAKVMEGDEGTTSGQTQTHSTLPAFSPKYASPEQVSRMKTGPWTDVHAVALLLTEVLLDAAPYESGDKLRLTAQVMSSTRPTPARFGVDVGPWEPVLARALALHPNDRYADAGELLSALEAAVAGAQRARAAMPQPLDEPTLTRTVPAAPPPAVAPVGAGTISAVVSQTPPAPPAPRAKTARLVGIAVVAALVGVATYSVGRARARPPRVEGAVQPVVAAPVVVESPRVASTDDAAVAVVDAVVTVAAPPVAVRPRVSAVRVEVGRPRTTRPRRLTPSVQAADERPPLE